MHSEHFFWSVNENENLIFDRSFDLMVNKVRNFSFLEWFRCLRKSVIKTGLTKETYSKMMKLHLIDILNKFFDKSYRYEKIILELNFQNKGFSFVRYERSSNFQKLYN